jgi:hypothetical protein
MLQNKAQARAREKIEGFRENVGRLSSHEDAPGRVAFGPMTPLTASLVPVLQFPQP